MITRHFGVVDDVVQIGIGQPHVQRVQHRAHARGRVVRLEMARAVPHERADAVADHDAGIAQRVRELVRAVAQLRVRSGGASRSPSP